MRRDSDSATETQVVAGPMSHSLSVAGPPSMSISQCLEQCVLGVRVEQERDAGCDIVADVEQLLPCGDRQEQRLSPFLHRQFRQSDRVRYVLDSPAERQTAHRDEPAPDVLLQQRTAEGK